MRIAGSVALVTGGASGLGLATAARLLGGGSSVVVLSPGSERAEKAVARLGSGAYFVPGDVTRPESVSEAIDAAARLGRLRVTISCAGVAVPGRVLGRRGPLPLDEFERVVHVNLVGSFNVARLTAAAMAGNDPLDGDRGVIVLTSSIAAFDGQEGQSAYAAAKAAIAGMTLPLARDLAAHAIRVATIAPGLFDTPMTAGLPEQARASLADATPHPARLGRPDEYASLVAHIIENPMLNGEVIRIDGGTRLARR
jgi:NAD(P)-dependent dehydrogenase (short-subunit alcohol dehydrogenase family)